MLYPSIRPLITWKLHLIQHRDYLDPACGLEPPALKDICLPESVRNDKRYFSMDIC